MGAGDGRGPMENASVTSEDSMKPSSRHDSSKMKGDSKNTSYEPTWLPADQFDPLKHHETEKFWHDMEFYFHPISQNDMTYLGGGLPINSYNGLRDTELRLLHKSDVQQLQSQQQASSQATGASAPSSRKQRDSKRLERERDRESKREKSLVDEHYNNPNIPLSSSSTKVKQESNAINPQRSSTNNSYNSDIPNNSNANANQIVVETESPIVRSSLNSFPYTQRLIAALIDDDVNGTAVPRHRATDDIFWPGVGSETDLRKYQSALETSIIHELNEKGWLDNSNTNANSSTNTNSNANSNTNTSNNNNEEDILEIEIRKEQWKLRDLKTNNRMRKNGLYSKVLTKMAEQKDRRQKKERDDQTEKYYLEKMISKLKKNKKSRAKYQKLLTTMNKRLGSKKSGAATAANNYLNSNHANSHANKNNNNNSIGGGGSKSNTNNLSGMNDMLSSSGRGGGNSNGNNGLNGGEEKVRVSGKKKKNKKNNNHDLSLSLSKGMTRKSAP